MPKSYFSVDRITSVHELPRGAAIHIIGVCGVAMAPLAVALSEAGYRVSGSDLDFYEPMGSLLRSSKVSLKTGYAAENLPTDIDLAVIGNAISYGNPEVEVIEQKDIPYTCFPSALYDLIIKGRHSIVVSGTHGKTTTTALTISALEHLARSPSYFVGGAVAEFPRSLTVGPGTISVVEGDEYDSAFFAKVPKFFFYKPDTWIITSLEFDHADIYADLEAIKQVFRQQAAKLGPESVVVACADYPELVDEVRRWERDLGVVVFFYGHSDDSHFKILSTERRGRGQLVEFSDLQGQRQKLEIALVGEHNAKNALAAYIALLSACKESDGLTDSLKHFQGVRRRQEVLFESPQVVVVEDFAHHPTAVRETVRAVRQAFPDRKIVAVFEPRSNTSRRKVFEADYINAFSAADSVVLSEVKARAHMDQGLELLDVSALARSIAATGVEASSCAGPDEIFEKIKQIPLSERPFLLLIMSNGSFGGLPARVKGHFEGAR